MRQQKDVTLSDYLVILALFAFAGLFLYVAQASLRVMARRPSLAQLNDWNAQLAGWRNAAGELREVRLSDDGRAGVSKVEVSFVYTVNAVQYAGACLSIVACVFASDSWRRESEARNRVIEHLDPANAPEQHTAGAVRTRVYRMVRPVTVRYDPRQPATAYLDNQDVQRLSYSGANPSFAPLSANDYYFAPLFMIALMTIMALPMLGFGLLVLSRTGLGRRLRLGRLIAAAGGAVPEARLWRRADGAYVIAAGASVKSRWVQAVGLLLVFIIVEIWLVNLPAAWAGAAAAVGSLVLTAVLGFLAWVCLNESHTHVLVNPALRQVFQIKRRLLVFLPWTSTLQYDFGQFAAVRVQVLPVQGRNFTAYVGVVMLAFAARPGGVVVVSENVFALAFSQEHVELAGRLAEIVGVRLELDETGGVGPPMEPYPIER
jgi:hypothetical protein